MCDEGHTLYVITEKVRNKSNAGQLFNILCLECEAVDKVNVMCPVGQNKLFLNKLINKGLL